MPAVLGNMSKHYCARLHEFWENILPTNFTNFRASECRAELVRALPSAAENLKANFRASERSRKCQEIERAHIAECSRKSQIQCFD